MSPGGATPLRYQFDQEARKAGWLASDARCGGVVSFGTFGVDVPVDGEPVVVSSYVADVENIRPQARFTTTAESGGLRLDASSSVDPDGITPVTTGMWRPLQMTRCSKAPW